jgi:hypothetical protein
MAEEKKRIKMLPTKGTLDPDLAIELVMDALREADPSYRARQERIAACIADRGRFARK